MSKSWRGSGSDQNPRRQCCGGGGGEESEIQLSPQGPSVNQFDLSDRWPHCGALRPRKQSSL